jgi:salicylate hydroxylase
MSQPSESSKTFSISIIGGGLTGLLLAIGLSNRGISFKIFEAAPSFSETSAGLGFGPNSVRAMAKLDPRIYDAFMKLKTENKFEEKKNTWFDVRKGWENIPSWVTQVEMGEGGGGNVLRASFLMELVKLLPPECAMFGKTLSDIDTGSDGSFNLLFEDGTSYNADAVVGCDGIRSRVRKVLFGQDSASKAVFSGTYLYRVVIEMQIAVRTLGEELAANSQIYMGQDCNVVTYPVEDGKLLNVIAFRRCDQEAWIHERWVVDSSEEELRSDFATMGASVQKIIKVHFSDKKK